MARRRKTPQNSHRGAWDDQPPSDFPGKVVGLTSQAWHDPVTGRVWRIGAVFANVNGRNEPVELSFKSAERATYEDFEGLEEYELFATNYPHLEPPAKLNVEVIPVTSAEGFTPEQIEPITADAIRRIPIGTLVDEMLQRHHNNLRRAITEMPDKATRADEERAVAFLPDGDRVIMAARIYNDAHWRRGNPTAAVIDELQVTRSVANRLVRSARHVGLITVDPPRMVKK